MLILVDDVVFDGSDLDTDVVVDIVKVVESSVNVVTVSVSYLLLVVLLQTHDACHGRADVIEIALQLGDVLVIDVNDFVFEERASSVERMCVLFQRRVDAS